MIKCPRCDHEFDEEPNFWWSADEEGDPCVENVECPKCHISTSAQMDCDSCPNQNTCELEDGCDLCDCVGYEEFIEVE